MIPGGEGRVPVPRCERRQPHAPHTYVVNPRSGVDLHCPGVHGSRSIGELIAAQPALAEIRGRGVTMHVLGVMSA